MSNLTQLELGAGREARIKGLLEDLALARAYDDSGPRLALAVWYDKFPGQDEQHLLELFASFGRTASERYSLWGGGSERPPFVNVLAMDVETFMSGQTSPYLSQAEVLYFDKNLLPAQVLEVFQIRTEPPGLCKGWYMWPHEEEELKSVPALRGRRGTKPSVGLLKIGKSEDTGWIPHVEVGQKWLPVAADDVIGYSYYNDGSPSGYFLFEDASLHEILKIDFGGIPEECAIKLLERARDGRYPRVYLRTVQQPEQPAA